MKDTDQQRRYLFYEYVWASTAMMAPDDDFYVSLWDGDPKEAALEFQAWIKDVKGFDWNYTLCADHRHNWEIIHRGEQGVYFRKITKENKRDEEKNLWHLAHVPGAELFWI